MLFKTLVIFLQKCFTKSDLSNSDKVNECFQKLQASILEFLDRNDLVNMELGYAASMIYILLITVESENTLTDLVNSKAYKIS